MPHVTKPFKLLINSHFICECLHPYTDTIVTLDLERLQTIELT